MLSCNYKKIFLENDMVAIFNNIILDILLVKKDELYNIENMLVDEDTKNMLINARIYVTSEQEDKEIISSVKKYFKNHSSVLDTLYIIPTSKCNISCNYCYI